MHIFFYLEGCWVFRESLRIKKKKENHISEPCRQLDIPINLMIWPTDEQTLLDSSCLREIILFFHD